MNGSEKARLGVIDEELRRLIAERLYTTKPEPVYLGVPGQVKAMACSE